ncbi:MAG: 23S rRNA (guanosine(2251)-2'-O)-methyltransferase RlmB [Chloroflexi bacterium]|nr:23S rRNA (guanosine(2251)-2'-O)-methyltransferase RlmB [Chloroflexota bacterium]MCL5074975.1 23S rRNA (guanosine(2251)-2'-O)-methyltransferase RlmB [Chloroflexota bacterium]
MDIIWGRNSVYEVLRGRRTVKMVYLLAKAKPTAAVARIVDLAQQRGIPLQVVDGQALHRITGLHDHQGVAVEVSAYSYADVDTILAEAQKRAEMPLLLILDSLQDPQNFGSLLRTAEAVGAHGVIIPKHRAVEVTAAVVRSSAGAVEHVPVARVTNLTRCLRFLKAQGIWVIGLDLAGERSYDEVDLTLPLALVVGGEGTGISRLVRENCDLLVKIPMRGLVGSLNAAVAGSLVLYHVWQQRKRGEESSG